MSVACTSLPKIPITELLTASDPQIQAVGQRLAQIDCGSGGDRDGFASYQEAAALDAKDFGVYLKKATEYANRDREARLLAQLPRITNWSVGYGGPMWGMFEWERHKYVNYVAFFEASPDARDGLEHHQIMDRLRAGQSVIVALRQRSVDWGSDGYSSWKTYSRSTVNSAELKSLADLDAWMSTVAPVWMVKPK